MYQYRRAKMGWTMPGYSVLHQGKDHTSQKRSRKSTHGPRRSTSTRHRRNNSESYEGDDEKASSIKVTKRDGNNDVSCVDCEQSHIDGSHNNSDESDDHSDGSCNDNDDSNEISSGDQSSVDSDSSSAESDQNILVGARLQAEMEKYPGAMATVKQHEENFDALWRTLIELRHLHATATQTSAVADWRKVEDAGSALLSEVHQEFEERGWSNNGLPMQGEQKEGKKGQERQGAQELCQSDLEDIEEQDPRQEFENPKGLRKRKLEDEEDDDDGPAKKKER